MFVGSILLIAEGHPSRSIALVKSGTAIKLNVAFRVIWIHATESDTESDRRAMLTTALLLFGGARQHAYSPASTEKNESS